MHNLQQFEHVTKMIMRWGEKCMCVRTDYPAAAVHAF